MFTLDVKRALLEYCTKGTRPAEHLLEVLRRLGYVDERGRLTGAGYAKGRELQAERRSDGARLDAPSTAAREQRGTFRRG